MTKRTLLSLLCCALFVAVLASAGWTWDVTDVYVKVSQDESGNFTTTTDRPDLWTGPNATWIRGRVRGDDGDGHYGAWPLGQIVRMGPFHEYDPTRTYGSFYGTAPMGADAYFMHVDHMWEHPAQVFVGTNFFSGMRVRDLVTMRYTTQLTYRQHPDTQESHPNWGQPPMVELNTDSGNYHGGAYPDKLIQYTFIYKPWGQNALNTSPPGNSWENRWHEIDCHNYGYWRLLHIDSSSVVGDWNWMLGRRQTTALPDKHLVTPLVGKYSDWYQGPNRSLCNPSGTSFSMKLGVPLASSDNSSYLGGESWACESVDTWGFFDKVVIGVADQFDGGGNVTHETRYTFDFENSTTPVPTMAAMGNATRKLANVKALEDTNLFVLFGKLVLTDDPLDEGFADGQFFTIDDGSGAPAKVICPGHELPKPNEWTTTYVRVEGRLFNLQAVDPRFTYYAPTHPYRQIHKHIMYSWPDKVTVY